MLIAEVEGIVAAALSIQSGVASADPFRPTVALVELLAQRAEQRRGDETCSIRRRASRSLWRNRPPRFAGSRFASRGDRNPDGRDYVLGGPVNPL